MFVAELRQGLVEALQLFQTFVVQQRAVRARQAFESVTGKLPLLDRVHAAPCEATLLVDEQVVHDPAQPRAGLVDFHEIVKLAECLDQQLLEQVFGLGFGAGQAPRKAVQAIEVRPHKSLKGQVLFGGTHNGPECITTYWRSKDPIGNFRASA